MRAVVNSILNYFLLACLLLLSAAAFSQGGKKYPSLLWKISGNGLKKSSYLYGTMHVSKKLAYHLSDQFFEGLKSAEVVGLETNPETWVENMERYGMFDNFKVSSSNYAGHLPNFYKDAFKLTVLNNEVYSGMIGFDPDIINGLLYRFNRNKENFEENTYIDLFIYQAATKWNKTVVSLEDFKTSLIKGKLADIPDEKEGSMSYDLKNYKEYPKVYEKIEDAYRRGDLDDLDSLSKLAGRTKNYLKYLLEDRNEIFVRSIDSVIRKSSMFAGVGAAHLPGENGVIELLRKKGYTVEPVMPKITHKSTKLKDGVDAMIKSVNLQKQFTSDSLVSFAAPGKMVDILADETVDFKLYADMANGCYYTLIRLKTLAPLYSYNEYKMKQKIDSLLYESIPGKIISKSEIRSNTGLQGFDIVNKTRRGDLQRYVIYISDLELFIFKLGGKGSYVKTNDAKQFFNSIQFAQRPNSYETFSPPTNGFSINIPSNHFYQKLFTAESVGRAEHLTAYDNQTGVFYGLIQSYYNDFAYIEEDSFELNILHYNVLRNYDFRIIEEKKITTEQGFPAIEFVASNFENKRLVGKIIIKGIHYYLLYEIGDERLTLQDNYFKEFKLSNFNTVNESRIVTDKAYAFSAKNELLENLSDVIDEEVNNEYVRNIKQGDPVNSKSFDYLFQDKNYFSHSSSEHVNLEFEKYNDYDYRNKSDIAARVRKGIVRHTSCYIADEKITDENGLVKFEFVLRDTGSVRAIKSVIVIKKGVVYELRCPYDVNEGIKGWASDFMETFSPTDSIIGKNLFDNKFKDLLKDLCSNDTSVRSRANISMSNISFQKAYLDDFLELVKSNDFHKISEDSRAGLLVNGGVIQDERIIQPYRDLYNTYSDSSYLQVCIIKGLAYLKTKSSYSTIIDLLSKDAPLVGNEVTVNDVFSVFYDSLELCRSFYPALLDLTRFQEYRASVYKLLSSMVRQKIISPANYAAQKQNILTEAIYELKRFNSTANAENAVNRSEGELLEDITRSLEESKSNETKQASGKEADVKSGLKPILIDYAFLLAPSYKDENVKSFFDKLLKNKNNAVLFSVYINLLENGYNINDTIWSYFSKCRETRVALYSELQRLGSLSLFDKNYLSQRSFCEAEIMNNLEIERLYENTGDKSKIEIEFVSAIDVANKYQKGKVYIYRKNDSRLNNGIERWAYAFVPDSDKELNSTVEVLNTTYYAERDNRNPYFNDIATEFSYVHRKRYSENSFAGR